MDEAHKTHSPGNVWVTNPTAFLAAKLRERDNEWFRRVGHTQTPLQRPWGELEPSMRAMCMEITKAALRDLREGCGGDVFRIEPDGSLVETREP